MFCPICKHKASSHARTCPNGGSSSSLTPRAGDATQGAKDAELGTVSDSPPPLTLLVPCYDPLGDAITVLENMRVTTLPMDAPAMTEIEQRRITALGYLRQELARRQQESAVWDALHEWQELEASPIRRGFEVDDAKIGFDEAWAKYREQRENYDRQRGRA